MGKHLDRAVTALVNEQLNSRLRCADASSSVPEDEVDHEKYPDVTQKYRFESISE